MADVVTVTLNTAIDRLIEVEGFYVGGHLPGRLLTRVPAGKGVNVSRALALSGVPNIATGFVGREELDDYERALEHFAVRPQFLAIDGATRENITLIDPKAGIETHVRELGPPPTPTDLDRLANKLNLIAKPEEVVVLSGSLPPGVSVNYVVGLVDMLLARGSRVAVDGPGELLRALGDRKLWLIKPNIEELIAMCGPGERLAGDEELPAHRTPTETEGTPLDSASGPPTTADNTANKPGEPATDSPSRAMPERPGPPTPSGVDDEQIVRLGRALSKRIRVVIVTSGAVGGYLFIDGSALIGLVDFDPRLARSSVSCGDCLLAAFVAAQLRGDSVKTSYEHALAVATAAAMEIVPGTFDPALVSELLTRTSVTPA